jgi:hypothetical protein
MDKEEEYWSKLEKKYVHDVYERISSKYDEFQRLDDPNTVDKENTNIGSLNKFSKIKNSVNYHKGPLQSNKLGK